LNFERVCPLGLGLVPLLAMASVGSVTRQIAALEISAKQNGATKPTRPLQKSVTQTSVSKLLTKFAAPNPFPDPKPPKSSVRTGPPRPANSAQSTARPPAPASQKAPAPAPIRSLSKPTSDRELDIGKYDGGFEIENEKRGEKIDGEAARELALDSSVSRSVVFPLASS
jgi:hypothetical protein